MGVGGWGWGVHRAEAEDKVSTQPHEYREGLEALPLPGLTNKGHMAKEKCKVRWPHEDSPFHRKGGHSSDIHRSLSLSPVSSSTQLVTEGYWLSQLQPGLWPACY